MNRVYLGIGGNLGDKANIFTETYKLIEIEIGKIIKRSSLYETSPWGFVSEMLFWNQVLMLETELKPTEILTKITKIEITLGRKRGKKQFESRTIDIDILYFNSWIIAIEDLIVPHPSIADRLFVLIPLVEITPNYIHPKLKLSNFEILMQCTDVSSVQKLT